MGIPSGRSIQQHHHLSSVSGRQWHLIVVAFYTFQGLIQHLLHRVFILLCNVVFNQVLTQYLLFGVTANLGYLLVPFVDQPIGIHPKDGSIGRIYQLGQFIGRGLHLLTITVDLKKPQHPC